MLSLFITGGTGFIGRVLVRNARDAGYAVTVLTRSEETARRLRNDGFHALVGDLAMPGAWQAEAARATQIVHLAQPPTFGARITRERAVAYRHARLRMDTLLLTSLDPAHLRRLIYVGGTSYYGDLGPSLCDETATPRPRGWGPFIAPAIETIPLHLARGLPVVAAFPGWVYGNGSWFRDYVLRPLAAEKRYLSLHGPSRIVSPVHVADCARALLHLLEHGAVGGRHFIVDDRPVPAIALAEQAARALGVPLAVRRVPRFVVELQAGRLVAESLCCDANLSNARLRALGFQFEFPSIDTGVPNVVADWRL